MKKITKKKATKRVKKVITNLEAPKVTKVKLIAKPDSTFPVTQLSASSMIALSTNPILFKIKYPNK
jgi:hypothetical protein